MHKRQLLLVSSVPVPLPLSPAYLVPLQHDLDPEQWVGRALPVAADGPGQFLQRPLDVQSERLLHHAVHLLRVAQPVRLDLHMSDKDDRDRV